MASAYIPKTGDPYGPCDQPCKHIDCEASREQAALICGICSTPLGEGSWWFKDQEYGPTHELCLLTKTEEVK